MKYYSLIFIALFLLFILLRPTNARVTYYIASLSPTSANSTSSTTNLFWRGNAVAELHTVGAYSLNASTRSSSTAQSRLKVICFHNIDENVTRAYINNDYTNTNFTRLFISKTLKAVSINIVINKSQEALLHNESFSIVLESASFPTGAISGKLLSRPYLYASWLQSQVNISSNKNVTTYNATTSVAGVAIAVAYSASATSPVIFSNTSTLFFSEFLLDSVLIHTIDTAYSGGIDVNDTSFPYNMAFDSASFIAQNLQLETLRELEEGLAKASIQLDQNANSSVLIGYFTPLLVPRQNKLPVSVALKNGVMRGDPSAMESVQLTGTQNNNSLCVWMIPGNSGEFEATLHWNFPVARQNIRAMRGLSLEVNMLSPATGQIWTFELYNQQTGSWDPIGIYGGTDEWLTTQSYLNGAKVVPYLHPVYASLIMRITSNGEDALLLDQFTFRPWLQNPDFVATARPNMFFFE
eukprot:TRINITY_DN2713_c0_g1_i1.p1 TRINITY_DN2713_c0_g1~~TRINITY_DN2713_c0_g1_i1.p1  ORF type:complete len:467 (+),score=76.55 TRINITY_DN2713_c0_g1_i1:215-1615(+)